MSIRLLVVLSGVLAWSAACGWPSRIAGGLAEPCALQPMVGFEDVRAIDGYPNDNWQRSFDGCVAALAATPVPADGRRDFDMLVLSSGGVNGAFGAGILTEWTKRGDRPDFWVVTGVSVGALMTPFVFAGPEFDQRLEDLFRLIEPSTMHREKSLLTSVLWDESLADNSPLVKTINQAVDERLLHAIADRHAEGRRCMVGSTNLDLGHFCLWDLGAIASRRNDEALQLLRRVLIASASVPVVYPPVRFQIGDADELHADGAIIRPLFIPQNVFDGYASADRAGISWDDIDATLYLVHNGSLRPCPVDVQRDTLAIATRTVTMMSYTMVAEHVLQLYMLTRAWNAEFRFHTMPDGLDLAMDGFTSDDTNRLFLLGAGLMQRREAWRESPPGFVVNADLHRIQPASDVGEATGDATAVSDSQRLQRIETELRGLRDELRELRALRAEGRAEGK